MRRKLLTLGALGLALVVDAQFLTYVGDKGQVYVKQGALVYNGGGMRTVGSGLVDNSGNIMVVGGASAKFATTTTSGTDKTDGGNIIMRMTNDAIGSLRYGQLYIKGLSQANITGIVDKEFKDKKHGDYQQVAIPFFGKNMGEFAKEAGIAPSGLGARWSKKEALVWDNPNVVFETLTNNDKTKANTAYYAIGTEAGSSYANGVVTVKGVPYADNITESLSGAGANVDFGVAGRGLNKYSERYNSYLQDFAYINTGEEAWTGDFGKDIYQFGNPFLTNLDLSRLAEKFIDIIAVRIESQGVVSEKLNYGTRTYATQGAKYISYDNTGVAIGDVNAVIRPLQTFVIKTSGDIDNKVLNFDDLRSFAYTPRAEATNKVTDGLTTSSLRNSNTLLRTNSLSSLSARRTLSATTSVVKQLDIIALDINGDEIGRTYFNVRPNAVTGVEPSEKKRQVIASSSNIIGTFEEKKEGGFDEVAANKYWLYINEANENDFKGKELPLALYSNDIKYLKFNIRENATLIDENASLSNGESFYIKVGDEIKEIRNGMLVPSNTNYYGLFYGNPNAKEEKLEEPVIERVNRTETDLVLDANTGEYKLLFASDWNTATITVYNRFGRVVSTATVDAKNDYTVNIPNIIGVYIVRAVSDTGVKFSKKVLKN